ncbi:hypothetical protein ACQ4PT_010617 [Festuca glaucescens]
MASSTDLTDHFDKSGPTHMMPTGGSSAMKIDWESEEHRRCVAACIVKGTYVLESDRTMCRQGLQAKALAPAWWESFHFRLMDVLTDDSFKHRGDKFIFGAIYEYAAPAGAPPRHPSAPQYVVAFRGTMMRHPKAIQDVYLDGKIVLNRLKGSNRSQRAHAAVHALLAGIAKRKESCVVWLAGHSLGASLALDVGRTTMEEQGLGLPTFLFNPPHVASTQAINLLQPSEVAKNDLYAASNLLKAGLGVILSPHRKRMEKLFQRLSPWAPKLYVHEKDFICQGFIDYFQQRERLEERFRGAAKSAMTLSYRDMFHHLVGHDKERPHLLPSATLWKNSCIDSDARWLAKRSNAHGLQQWWKSDADLSLTSRHYTYPVA